VSFANRYSAALKYSHGSHDDTVDQLLGGLTDDDLGHEEGNSTNRLVAADALQEAGRDEEAGHLRGKYPIQIDDSGKVRRAPTDGEREEFKQGFLTTALWQAPDVDDAGTPLTEDHDPDQIHPDSRKRMEEEADGFLHQHYHLLKDKVPGLMGEEFGQAGHDYALSRNGHGAGFFDGPYEHASELQKHAKSDGSYDLYRGDDGLIHYH
jgi:hypothetical protein